jgi:hypothetical protein
MPDRYGEEQPEHFDPYTVAGCFLCDDNGYRGHLVCNHVDYQAAAKRGMEMIRAALNKEKK